MDNFFCLKRPSIKIIDNDQQAPTSPTQTAQGQTTGERAKPDANQTPTPVSKLHQTGNREKNRPEQLTVTGIFSDCQKTCHPFTAAIIIDFV